MANPSLQIGNGKFAIKENNLLGYSSSGTRFFPIPITMTRATLGTRVNPSGLVENVELLGNELVDNGSFTTDTDWNKLNGSTISGGVGNVVANGSISSTGNNWGLYQDVGMILGSTYKISFSARQTGGTGDFQVGQGYVGFSQSITSSFVNYSFNITAADWNGNTATLTMGGLTVGDTFEVDNVSVKEVTRDGLARVDYTDGTGSLLVEPQRTNLLTYSEDFSQFPISNRLVITPNDITSPDGTINASKMQQADGVTTAPNIAFSNVLSGTYTVSAFAKKGTRSFLAISFNGISYFDLQNGTITTTGSGHTASIENFGNDWYRCSIVKTISTTQTAAFYFADTNNTLTTADDEGYMYLYGTQLEQGSYPTSYIKTQGSTVTRNQDQYTKTGISDKINSEEGVLFVESSVLSNDGTYKAFSLSDGTTSNTIRFYTTPTLNQLAIRVTVSGSHEFNVIFTLTDLTVLNKMALKYKSNDFAFWVNGVEVKTSTSGNTYTANTLNSLRFDRGDGVDTFFGKVKQLQVFKTALSDSELATLTTI